MSAASFAALASALGVGGVAGIGLRAAHERNEQSRDRLIAGVETFLRHVIEARAKLEALQSAPDGRPDPALVSEAQEAVRRVRETVPLMWIWLPAASEGGGPGPGPARRAGNMWRLLDWILRDLEMGGSPGEMVATRVADSFRRLEGHIWFFGQQTRRLAWQRRLGQGFPERVARRYRRRFPRERRSDHWFYEMDSTPVAGQPYAFTVFRVESTGRSAIGSGGETARTRHEADIRATDMAREDLAKSERTRIGNRTARLDVESKGRSR